MPSFKSIEAFVAAARVLSFTQAAAMLHLTVPAISRRVRALELELGVPLFERSHRALQLTDAGDAYLTRLAPAIDTIRRASDGLRDGTRGNSLTVSLPASLAANWLVARLPAFQAAHRDIEVELRSMNGHGDKGHGDLEGSEADLAIWPGTGKWEGLRAERLFDMDAYPVCSADFLDAHPALRHTRDLTVAPLLGIAGQQEAWNAWLQAAGVADRPHIGSVFDNFHLLYRAAASGLGVALGVDVIVRPYLEQGLLVRPFDVSFKLMKGYYVVCRSNDWMQPPVSTFRQWLTEQAGAGR
jgi:LysR family transcriptional regulator, glycine cleavage system transcriptional activator